MQCVTHRVEGCAQSLSHQVEPSESSFLSQLLRMGLTEGQRMAREKSSQHRQCQHFGESMSSLREHFGRQHLLAKSFKGPSPVMLSSRSAAVQHYEPTGGWLTQEDHESSEHLVMAALEFPRQMSSSYKGLSLSQILLHCLLFDA